mmetsp:Transcript_20305/g.64895  ORF Transcript_20305/g.64895 Transcript_20305/m.64895 type:complete len:210 (-) Transcript_20305:143-772(-)
MAASPSRCMCRTTPSRLWARRAARRRRGAGCRPTLVRTSRSRCCRPSRTGEGWAARHRAAGGWAAGGHAAACCSSATRAAQSRASRSAQPRGRRAPLTCSARSSPSSGPLLVSPLSSGGGACACTAYRRAHWSSPGAPCRPYPTRRNVALARPPPCTGHAPAWPRLLYASRRVSPPTCPSPRGMYSHAVFLVATRMHCIPAVTPRQCTD